jgi:glycine dehydrogenase subunit 1
VVKTSVEYKAIKDALLENGMIAGLHLGDYDESLKNHILFCVTEKRTKAEINQLVRVLGGLK